jgi:group I intron endonuclease
MKSGIYKIINPNGKAYIGKATNITRRKNAYRGLFCTKQPKIFNSLKKYSWDAHVFDIMEICPKEELIEKEIYYKTEFIKENGWDMALFLYIKDEGGECLTDETKAKISKAKKGHKCFTDEWKNKISKTLKERNHSQYYTEEVKNKISKNNKGKPKPFSDEHKKAMGVAKRKQAKTVLQCDLSDNVIKEWESKGQAASWIKEQTGKTSNLVSQIKDCILGRQKTAFGFKWKYK